MHGTATRVEDHTANYLNRQIHQRTEERIDFYRQQGEQAISQRLEELDREWDTERTLQTNFAVLSTVGAIVTARVQSKWAWLALGVPAFMVQHSLQGWCPPLAVLRRLGVRTTREINEERFALKALRGDFEGLDDSKDADALLRAVDRR